MCLSQKKNFETMVVMGWTKSLSLDSWVPPPKKKELSCFLIFPHIQELEGGKGSKEEKKWRWGGTEARVKRGWERTRREKDKIEEEDSKEIEELKKKIFKNFLNKFQRKYRCHFLLSVTHTCLCVCQHPVEIIGGVLDKSGIKPALGLWAQVHFTWYSHRNIRG